MDETQPNNSPGIHTHVNTIRYDEIKQENTAAFFSFLPETQYSYHKVK